MHSVMIVTASMCKLVETFGMSETDETALSARLSLAKTDPSPIEVESSVILLS